MSDQQSNIGTASAVARDRKPVDGLTPRNQAVISSGSARRAPSDLSDPIAREIVEQAKQGIRDDIAARKAKLLAVRNVVRSHRPLPKIERQLDLGELGVFKAEISYDSGPGMRATFDTDSTPGWFHITAITMNGNDVDVLPILRAALGAETIDELADTIAAELREAA